MLPTRQRIGLGIQDRLSRVKALPILSKLSPSSSIVPTPDVCEGFQQAQRLAYDCALVVAKELQPGWTEKKTARLMDAYLRDHGVKSFFHRSFAWFGDRSRFWKFKTYLDFLPSRHRLQEDDVVILDTAPILNGYAGDIGYTLSLQPHTELQRAQGLLKYFRRELPKWFETEMRAKDIFFLVDQKINEAGFDNCHKHYPMSVLGHRLHKVPGSSLPSLLKPFGWQAYWAILSRGLFPELLNHHHEGSKIGIWALEPHLGGDGFGAKFEEILVVTPERSYWLDDTVPHNV
jgi:hypothetical protein